MKKFKVGVKVLVDGKVEPILTASGYDLETAIAIMREDAVNCAKSFELVSITLVAEN